MNAEAAVCRSRRWFTLIELMVVIAIVAILAGMLLAVLTQAKEKAKKAECFNNLKQLTLAFELYAQEWNETFPFYTDAPSGAGREGGWVYYDGFPVPTHGQFDPARGTLFQYTKEIRLYRCASDPTKSLCSYGANGDTSLRRLSEVPSPSETPLLLEEGAGQPTTNDGFFNIWYNIPDHVENRHNRGSTFGYVDGHVEWARMSDRAVYNRCNFLNQPPSYNWPAE